MPRSCPSEMKSDVPTSVWRCVETYTQKRPPTAVDPTVEPNVEPPPNAIGCVSRTGGLPEEPSEDGMYAMFHSSLCGSVAGGVVQAHNQPGVLQQHGAEMDRRACPRIGLLVIPSDTCVDAVLMRRATDRVAVEEERLLRRAGAASPDRIGQASVNGPVEAHEPTEPASRPGG